VLLPHVNSDGFQQCLQQKNNATTITAMKSSVIIKQESLMQDGLE
jgi:hypothetical protein